jgi:hypothetical protein
MPCEEVNMYLTTDQLKAVQEGEPLRFTDPGTSTEFVVVRADVYDRVATTRSCLANRKILKI